MLLDRIEASEAPEAFSGTEDDSSIDAGSVRAADSLELHLPIRDREVLDALRGIRDDAERSKFALVALRIGVLSLKHARGEVDAASVRDEVDRLLTGLHTALDQHRESLNARTEEVLKQYFDPESGRFAERVERLTKDDGELAALLRRHLSADDSTLVRTLASHVGSDSPLLRLVDPQNGAGLVATLRTLVASELDEQREKILAEFSLDREGSALRRLVAELGERHGQLSTSLATQIDTVMHEFSLDTEDSALSRLVDRVEKARQQITAEFTLDSETSALARLKRELLTLVEKQSEAISSMEKTVRGEISAIVARREESKRSTVHGREFEQDLLSLVGDIAQRAGDVFEDTTATTGQIKNCKTGDAVLTLGPEHQAAGARIVVEAKQQAGYSLAHALAELDQAKKNRDALVGVFVFSKRSAPIGLGSFARFGASLVVVWDPEEAGTDIVVEAALSVAKAICVQTAAPVHDAVDLGDLDRAILDVGKQIDGLEEIRKSADTIEHSSKKILERVRILGDNLRRSVAALERSAAAVKRALGEPAEHGV